MKCPKCKIETKHIIQHLAKHSHCKAIADVKAFKMQFQLYKASLNRDQVKESQRNRKKKCIDNQRKENNDKVKESQRNHEKKCIDNHQSIKEIGTG